MLVLFVDFFQILLWKAANSICWFAHMHKLDYHKKEGCPKHFPEILTHIPCNRIQDQYSQFCLFMYLACRCMCKLRIQSCFLFLCCLVFLAVVGILKFFSVLFIPWNLRLCMCIHVTLQGFVSTSNQSCFVLRFVRKEASLPSILTLINLVIHVSKRCFMKK